MKLKTGLLLPYLILIGDVDFVWASLYFGKISEIWYFIFHFGMTYLKERRIGVRVFFVRLSDFFCFVRLLTSVRLLL